MLGSDKLGEQALNKIAKLALSSQLEASDRLDVRVKTNPEKLASGELEALEIDGEGLIIETDLRLQVLEIEMAAIAVSPLKALTGNIKLTQPTEGTARIVLTETDLNRAFNSKELRAKISVLDTYIDNGTVELTVPRKTCQLRSDGTVAVDALIELHPSGDTQEVSFTTKPQIAPDRQGIVLNDIQYASGKEVSPELTEAFLDKANKMLNLRHFEKEGLSLRIHQLNVEAGQITLLAAADITQFPRL